MSYKLNNSHNANCDSMHWIKNPNTDVNVKFAGDEAKDRLYEPKHKKKLVRVLTVVAYIFFVSLAAIMLSLYYVFIWNGQQKENNRLKTVVVPFTSKCNNEAEASENIPVQLPTQAPVEYDDSVLFPFSTEKNLTWETDLNELNQEGDNLTDFTKDSSLLKRLLEDI